MKKFDKDMVYEELLDRDFSSMTDIYFEYFTGYSASLMDFITDDEERMHDFYMWMLNKIMNEVRFTTLYNDGYISEDCIIEEH